MNLRGWDYTGRNIGSELHKQFRIMIDCLSDPAFTNHSAWGGDIQERLAQQMQMTSSGAVRTVKKVCVNFGFLNGDSFSRHNEIDTENLLTYRGNLVYHVAKLEEQVGRETCYSAVEKEKIQAELKKLYEEIYCDALRSYYFRNEDGTRLHPLRATLRALERYGCMDKWEWYLLNTHIRQDDCAAEEAALDADMARYRNGSLIFTNQNIIENPKGHQYIPQYFEFAGLLCVAQGTQWSMRDSGRHEKVKSEVLQDDFLEKLYGGSL